MYSVVLFSKQAFIIELFELAVCVIAAEQDYHGKGQWHLLIFLSNVFVLCQIEWYIDLTMNTDQCFILQGATDLRSSVLRRWEKRTGSPEATHGEYLQTRSLVPQWESPA